MAYRHSTKIIDLPEGANTGIAVVSDTHGRAHPNLFPVLEKSRPSLILHAGDVGDLDLIMQLEEICRTVYVRGNTDPTGRLWPDSVSLLLQLGRSSQLDLLLIHIAVARLRLVKDVLSLLCQNPARLVVFGHSHMPFLGMDGKIGLFNPGSAGPPRMGLPVTMGLIEILSGQLKFRHLDLRTGEEWKPTFPLPGGDARFS